MSAAGIARARTTRRQIASAIAVGLCAASVLLALVPLGLVLSFVLSKGIQALNWSFFTRMPMPVGETGGGMANAIVGTLMLSALGALGAVPIGIISGIYISEYAGSRFGSVVRFAADTLNGVPSIVIGVFVYAIAVRPLKQFSMLAGSIALGIMMIPIITRTTEELLRLVPHTLREGALALGATRARAVFTVVLPAALPGIITGVVLALARIAGETAPLLFTSFNNHFWNLDPMQPTAALTVQIYTYATSPYRGLAPAGMGRRARPGRNRAAVLDPGAHQHATAGADVARRLTAVRPRRRPGRRRPCRRARNSRAGSWRDTAGGSPRRNRNRAPARSPW